MQYIHEKTQFQTFAFLPEASSPLGKLMPPPVPAIKIHITKLYTSL